MPNQLSVSKRRKTVAEHAAVLEALECVAEAEGTTSTDLVRRATRKLLRARLSPRPGRWEANFLQGSVPVTPVCHYTNPDRDDAEIVVEIEPDFAVESIRILAIAAWPERDCEPVYMRHVAVGSPHR